MIYDLSDSCIREQAGARASQPAEVITSVTPLAQPIFPLTTQSPQGKEEGHGRGSTCNYRW